MQKCTRIHTSAVLLWYRWAFLYSEYRGCTLWILASRLMENSTVNCFQTWTTFRNIPYLSAEQRAGSPCKGSSWSTFDWNTSLAFIPPTLWPPNSSDWIRLMIKSGQHLRQHLRSECTRWKWTMLMSCLRWTWQGIIIDKAFKQWRTRPRACVEAKSGHFENKL